MVEILKDKIKKYYSDEYDLNCAETILYAANEEYEMNLQNETLKTMAAFGGGMGVEGVCGAISSALCVLSILYTKERAHEGNLLKELSQSFYSEFLEELGSENCKYLKAQYRNDEERCSKMIFTAGEILDKIVKEQGN